MNYDQELSYIKQIIKEVGGFLRSQNEKAIESAQGRDIKLELDKQAENLIIQKLSEKYSYSIVSEETGLHDRGSDLYWIVDPIDGTMNYSRDMPLCCISIALWKDKLPVLGAIYDFNRDELFSGHVEKGAFLNDEKIEVKNKVTAKSDAVFATGVTKDLDFSDGNIQKMIKRYQGFKKIRMIGSAALSLAYVSCGRFDVYLEESIKIWDVAAGLAIIKSLGGDYKIEWLDSSTCHVCASHTSVLLDGL